MIALRAAKRATGVRAASRLLMRDRCKRSRLDKANLRLSRLILRAPDSRERKSIFAHRSRCFAIRDRGIRVAISGAKDLSIRLLWQDAVSALQPNVPIRRRLAHTRKDASDLA